MTIDTIMQYIENSTVEFIAIITFSVSILSGVLAMIEYFRLKGKWDYYYLDDSGRTSIRSGFNPEYLATSLFIIGIMFFVIINSEIRNIIDDVSKATIIIFVITIIIYISAYVIFYMFSKSDVQKGIYLKKEYYGIIAEKALFTTIKYLLQIILFYLVYKAITTLHYMEILPCILISGAFMVLFEYYIAKNITSKNRVYDIIKYNGRDYCVLSYVNSFKYYIVKVKINDNQLKLYLSTRILIDSNGVEIYKNYFKEIIRIYNGNIIKSGKFYIGWNVVKQYVGYNPTRFFIIRNTSAGGRWKKFISTKYDFPGVYIIHNHTKEMNYVGQGEKVFQRVNSHFTGHGNGDVYVDYKYGDEFTIKMIALENSGFSTLNELERNTITTYNDYAKGYNRTRGNKG